MEKQIFLCQIVTFYYYLFRSSFFSFYTLLLCMSFYNSQCVYRFLQILSILQLSVIRPQLIDRTVKRTVGVDVSKHPMKQFICINLVRKTSSLFDELFECKLCKSFLELKTYLLCLRQWSYYKHYTTDAILSHLKWGFLMSKWGSYLLSHYFTPLLYCC